MELNNIKIKEFINLLFDPDDIVNIRRIEEPKQATRDSKIQTKNFPVSQFPKIIDNYENKSEKYGTFICANPLKPHTRLAQINLKNIKTIVIDFDDKAEIVQSKENEVEIRPLVIQPNIISSRGERNHHFYYLIEPIENNNENIKKYKAIVKYFIKNYGADLLVINPAGLIRLPETIRYKDDKKEKYEFEIISEKRYKIDDIIKELNIDLLEPVEEKTEKKKTEKNNEKIENFNPVDYVYNRNKKIYTVNKIESGKGRSYKLYQIGCECRDWGIECEKALEIATTLNEEIFDYPENQYIVKHQINSAYRYARNEPGQRLEEFNNAASGKKQNEFLKKYHEEEKTREKLNDYVFVLSLSAIRHKTKEKIYSGKEHIGQFLLSEIGTTLTFNLILFRGLINRVDNVDFRPDIKKQKYIDKGNSYLNTFQGIPFLLNESYKEILPDNKGLEIFLNHIRYLTCSEYTNETTINYLAHNLQFPGVKIPYSLLFINHQTGTGRSWLEKLFNKFFDEYCIGIQQDNIKKGYTQYMKEKLFIFIHEIKDNDSFNFLERFKSHITEPRIYIEEKYAKSYWQTNTVNFMFFSNHHDAIKIDKYDRRLMVVLSDRAPLTDKYYEELNNIINNPAQLLAIFNYLMSYDLSEYNPYKRPEITEGKKKMIDATKSEVNLYLDELKENDELFENEFVTIKDIQNKVQNYGSNVVKNKVTEKQIKHFLTANNFYQVELNRRIKNQRIHCRIWVDDINKKINDESVIKILNLNVTENQESEY